jgi:hypothetical protein
MDPVLREIRFPHGSQLDLEHVLFRMRLEPDYVWPEPR